MLIREIVPADAKDYLEPRIQSEQEFPQFVGLSAEAEIAAGRAGLFCLRFRGQILNGMINYINEVTEEASYAPRSSVNE
jgi:hypothetical protein